MIQRRAIILTIAASFLAGALIANCGAQGLKAPKNLWVTSTCAPATSLIAGVDKRIGEDPRFDPLAAAVQASLLHSDPCDSDSGVCVQAQQTQCRVDVDCPTPLQSGLRALLDVFARLPCDVDIVAVIHGLVGSNDAKQLAPVLADLLTFLASDEVRAQRFLGTVQTILTTCDPHPTLQLLASVLSFNRLLDADPNDGGASLLNALGALVGDQTLLDFLNTFTASANGDAGRDAFKALVQIVSDNITNNGFDFRDIEGTANSLIYPFFDNKIKSYDQSGDTVHADAWRQLKSEVQDLFGAMHALLENADGTPNQDIVKPLQKALGCALKADPTRAIVDVIYDLITQKVVSLQGLLTGVKGLTGADPSRRTLAFLVALLRTLDIEQPRDDGTPTDIAAFTQLGAHLLAPDVGTKFLPALASLFEDDPDTRESAFGDLMRFVDAILTCRADGGPYVPGTADASCGGGE